MFGKLLYLQSIIVGELTKPIGKRAEWIVYVADAPFHFDWTGANV